MLLKDYIPIFGVRNEETYKFKFTIFTPVYNAENTIEKVHESLLKQSFNNFEWLIINDGSIDSSNLLIKNIVANSKLSINYINNPINQHKMACFMQAVHIAKGEFFLIFDADDECINNALEILNSEYEKIPDNQKMLFAGVTGLCEDQNGKLVGTKYPTSPFISDPFEIRAKKNIKGEKWGFTKLSLLKRIQINENLFSKGYIPESIVWNLIAKEGFKTKFINKVLRIYNTNVENSIMYMSKRSKNSGIGGAVNFISNINWFYKDYFFSSPLIFLKYLYLLLRTSRYLDFTVKNYLTSIDSSFIKILFVLLWPIRKFLR
jgi:glycosyltransferase involved in cell wall biosynthesis